MGAITGDRQNGFAAIARQRCLRYAGPRPGRNLDFEGKVGAQKCCYRREPCQGSIAASELAIEDGRRICSST
jgi:hypothetical protein